MTRSPYADWAELWLDELCAYADDNRVARGSRYAHAGKVTHVTVERGAISGQVAGSRRHPYEVTIEVAPLPAYTLWDVPVSYLAELLTERPDPEVLGDLLELAPQIVPEGFELNCHCTCPDWEELCKHVIALGTVFGAQLIHDVTPLLTFRGLDRESLLHIMMENAQAESARGTGRRAQTVGTGQSGRPGQRPGPSRNESGGDRYEANRSSGDRSGSDHYEGDRSSGDRSHGQPDGDRSYGTVDRDVPGMPRAHEVDVARYWHGFETLATHNFRILHGADQMPESVLASPLPWPRSDRQATYLQTIGAAYECMNKARRLRKPTVD